jgi:hypothetical protein
MAVRGDVSCLADPIAQELLTSRIPARLAYTWSDGTPRVVPNLVPLGRSADRGRQPATGTKTDRAQHRRPGRAQHRLQ